MNIHFQKLENGDWVCYDHQNTTGDLFVDPEKIGLLTAMLPPAVNLGAFYSYDIQQELWLSGFGRMQVIARLRINTNGVIKNFSLLNAGSQFIGDFTNFVLDLEALPAFDEYVYDHPTDEDAVNEQVG